MFIKLSVVHETSIRAWGSLGMSIFSRIFAYSSTICVVPVVILSIDNKLNGCSQSPFLSFFYRYHILETLGKPVPCFGMDWDNIIRINLLNSPRDVFTVCMPRSMIAPLKAQFPFIVQREAARINVKALQPVPKPLELNLHLFVEGLQAE